MNDRDPEVPSAQPPMPATQTLDWQEGDMPYSREFGDHFYCREDGRLECGHVFLAGNGLPDRWRDMPSPSGDFRIGELGFGTGLNVCETVRQWKLARKPDTRLQIVSFELFPMRREDLDRALSRWPQIDAERQALVAAWPDEPAGRIEIAVDPQTRLTIVCGPALAGVTKEASGFDAWFLDGFAPSRNPDMWSAELMQALFDRTSDGGSFGTYAAAGFVRRNLAAAGFRVERRPGFAGKREMLCGTRPPVAGK